MHMPRPPRLQQNRRPRSRVECRFRTGHGTLVGAPSFGRLVVLTLVGPPDAVIADGLGGIAPDFTSTAAAETPNECTELGRRLLFLGTYHCRHAMTVPEPSFRGSCVELVLLLVADPWAPVQRTKRVGGLRPLAFHQTNKRCYATGPAGGNVGPEEDLATLSRRLSRRWREGACAIWKSMLLQGEGILMM